MISNTSPKQFFFTSPFKLLSIKSQGFLNLPNDLLVSLISFLDIDSLKNMEKTSSYFQKLFQKHLWFLLCKSEYSYKNTPEHYDDSYDQIFRILYLNRYPEFGITRTINGPALQIRIVFIKTILKYCIYFQDGYSKIVTDKTFQSISVSTLFVSFQKESHTLWITEILFYQTLKYSLHYNFQHDDTPLVNYKTTIFERQYIIVEAQGFNNDIRYLYIFDLLAQNTHEFYGNLQPLFEFKFQNRNATGALMLHKHGKYDYSITNSIDFDNIRVISKLYNNFFYLLLEKNQSGESSFLEINLLNLQINSIELESNQTFLKFIPEHDILAIINHYHKTVIIQKLCKFCSNKMISLDVDIIFTEEPVPSIIENNDLMYLILFNRVVVLNYELEIVTSIFKPEFCIKWIFNRSNDANMIDCFLEAANEFFTYFCKLKKDEFNFNFLENIQKNGMKIPYKSNITIINSQNEPIQIEFSTINKIEKIGHNSYYYAHKRYNRSYQQDHVVVDFFRFNDDDKVFLPLIDFMLISDNLKFTMIRNDGKLCFISKEGNKLEQFFDFKTSVRIISDFMENDIFEID